MNLSLLTVGTELLLGHIVDTNGAEIGRLMAGAGITVVRRSSVADDGAAIRRAVDDALRQEGAVLVTGGLGPTRDDVTKHAVSDLLDMPLVFDETVWAALQARFRRLGRPTPESNRSQAMVPLGGTVLPNAWGTAPGLWLEGPRGLVIMLPGVPVEMRNLLREEVLPRLAPRAGGTVIRSRTLRTTSIAESALAERLGAIEDAIQPVSLAYLPGLEGVDLRLTSWGQASTAADDALERAARQVRARAGGHVYGEGDETLAAVLVRRLAERGERLAVAESCTGGLLAGRVTDVPGSSAVFDGGVVAYANRVKSALLGVPRELLDEAGAVSEAVAVRMAEGVRLALGTDHGIGVTGVAGPGGGTGEKPVGMVWTAAAGPAGTEAVRAIFPGSRAEIRSRAVQAALFLLLRKVT